MQDKLILYVDNNFYAKLEIWEALGDNFTIHTLTNGLEAYKWLLEGNTPDLIIAEVSLPGYNGLNFLENVRNNGKTSNIPFILLCDRHFSKYIKEAKRLGANDIYLRPLNFERLRCRIETLIRLRELRTRSEDLQIFIKRFDLKRSLEAVCAFAALVLLSPLFLLIGLIIIVNSRGPVFNVTPMVGEGYKIFNHYRFRVSLWQKPWKSSPENSLRHDSFLAMPCEECQQLGKFCSPLLYVGDKSICENQHKKNKSQRVNSMSEPGETLTKIGEVLRKSGIEHWPNLINIMKGEMSFIGVEGLTPEMAQLYTSDDNSGRFLFPIGMITSSSFSKLKVGDNKLMFEN